jgi:hypothetical protein
MLTATAAGRAGQLPDGRTTPLLVPAFGEVVWSLYETGGGYVTLAFRESWQ